MAMACVPGPLQQVLRVTGADQVLRLFDTVEDARIALTGCTQAVRLGTSDGLRGRSAMRPPLRPDGPARAAGTQPRAWRTGPAAAIVVPQAGHDRTGRSAGGQPEVSRHSSMPWKLTATAR